MIGHPGAGLGTKILDNDFLKMAVSVVQLAQQQERLKPLAPGLADADQDARREGNRALTGSTHDRQARGRLLVRRSEMGPPARA